MRALEIVFRILWSVVLGGLIYGSAIWLLRVELSGDIERMEPGKAWLLGGLAWINAVVILVIGGMDGRLPEENRLGQKFLVSCILYVDTRKAGKTDDLEASVNYGTISHLIKEKMEEFWENR